VSFVPIARGPTIMNDLYDIPVLETSMKAVYSNTTPASAAIVNAVIDALAGYGVTHLYMPLTSEKVRRAMHALKVS
jgi:CO/xanthine dehydrogenase Mo-binding subunit